MSVVLALAYRGREVPGKGRGYIRRLYTVRVLAATVNLCSSQDVAAEAKWHAHPAVD